MIVFDTDGWDARDRVERWREEFGRSVIRAEVSAQGEQPQSFAVRMALLGGEQLSSLDMRLRSLRKVRDHRWFGDGADDLTFMLCIAGNVRFDTNGERRILRRGEAALFSTSFRSISFGTTRGSSPFRFLVRRSSGCPTPIGLRDTSSRATFRPTHSYGCI